MTDTGPLTSMSPRPSPPGSEHVGRLWVWAVDEAHLPNYLLPRDCPRVCWRATGTSGPLLPSAEERVVAVEEGWVGRLGDAGLTVLELAPEGFTLLDAQAGYWVAERTVHVVRASPVDDGVAALAQRRVELRAVASLWPYLDAAVAQEAEFSGIRLRYARPRGQD